MFKKPDKNKNYKSPSPKKYNVKKEAEFSPGPSYSTKRKENNGFVKIEVSRSTFISKPSTSTEIIYCGNNETGKAKVDYNEYKVGSSTERKKKLKEYEGSSALKDYKKHKFQSHPDDNFYAHREKDKFHKHDGFDPHLYSQESSNLKNPPIKEQLKINPHSKKQNSDQIDIKPSNNVIKQSDSQRIIDLGSYTERKIYHSQNERNFSNQSPRKKSPLNNNIFQDWSSNNFLKNENEKLNRKIIDLDYQLIETKNKKKNIKQELSNYKSELNSSLYNKIGAFSNDKNDVSIAKRIYSSSSPERRAKRLEEENFKLKAMLAKNPTTNEYVNNLQNEKKTLCADLNELNKKYKQAIETSKKMENTLKDVESKIMYFYEIFGTSPSKKSRQRSTSSSLSPGKIYQTPNSKNSSPAYKLSYSPSKFELLNNIDEVYSKVKNIIKNHEELKKKFEDKEEKLLSYADKERHYNQELDRLKRINKEICENYNARERESVNNLEKANTKIRIDLEDANKINQSLKKRLEQNTQDYFKEIKELKNRIIEYENAKTQIDKAELIIKNRQSQVEKLEKTLNELIEEKNYIVNKNNELKNENKTLKRKIEQEDKERRKEADIRIINEEMEIVNCRLEKIIQDQENEHEKEIEKLIAEIIEKKTKIEELVKESKIKDEQSACIIRESNNSIFDLKDIIMQLENETIPKLEKEKEFYESELKNLKNLSITNKSLDLDSLNIKDEKIKQLLKENAMLNSTVKDLDNQIKKFSTEKEELKIIIDNAKELIDQTQQENQNLHKDQEDYCKKIDNLYKKFEEQLEENKKNRKLLAEKQKVTNNLIAQESANRNEEFNSKNIETLKEEYQKDIQSLLEKQDKNIKILVDDHKNTILKINKENSIQMHDLKLQLEKSSLECKKLYIIIEKNKKKSVSIFNFIAQLKDLKKLISHLFVEQNKIISEFSCYFIKEFSEANKLSNLNFHEKIQDLESKLLDLKNQKELFVIKENESDEKMRDFESVHHKKDISMSEEAPIPPIEEYSLSKRGFHLSVNSLSSTDSLPTSRLPETKTEVESNIIEKIKSDLLHEQRNVKNLDEKLEIIKQENIIYEEETNKIKAISACLEEKLYETTDELNKLKERFSIKNEDFLSLANDYKSLMQLKENTELEYNEKILQLHSKINEMASVTEEKNAQLNKLNQEKLNLTKLITEKDDRNIKNVLEKMNIEIERHQLDNIKLSHENNDLKKNTQDLQKKIFILQQKEEISQKSLKHWSSSEDKIAFLETKIAEKQKKFELLLNVFRNFKGKISQEKALLKSNLNLLNNIIKSFNSDKINIIKECAKAQNMVNKLASSDENANAQKKKIFDLEKNISSKIEEIKILNKEVLDEKIRSSIEISKIKEAENIRNAESEEKNRKLTEENIKLQSCYAELDNKLRHELKVANDRIQLLQKENETLNQQQKVASIEENNKIRLLQLENTELLQKYQELELKAREFIETIEKNHNYIEKNNFENKKQMHELEEKLISSHLQLENEKKQSYNTLNEKSQIISKLQLENSQILKELEAIKTDQLSSNAILKNLDHETLNEIRSLESTIEDLKSKLKIIQNNNAELANYNHKQKENLENIQKEYQELKTKTAAGNIKQEEEIKRLRYEIKLNVESILTKEMNSQIEILASENKILSDQVIEKSLLLERINSQTDEFKGLKMVELVEHNNKLIAQNTQLKALVKALKMS